MTTILDDMKSRFDGQTPMVTQDTLKEVLAMSSHFELAHKIGEFENDPDGEIVRNSLLGHIDAFGRCALWMLNSYVGETSAEEVVDRIWDAMEEFEKPMTRSDGKFTPQGARESGQRLAYSIVLDIIYSRRH